MLSASESGLARWPLRCDVSRQKCIGAAVGTPFLCAGRNLQSEPHLHQPVPPASVRPAHDESDGPQTASASSLSWMNCTRTAGSRPSLAPLATDQVTLTGERTVSSRRGVDACVLTFNGPVADAGTSSRPTRGHHQGLPAGTLAPVSGFQRVFICAFADCGVLSVMGGPSRS
jgi:hypothetical protein